MRFVTEGVLTRQLLADAFLEKIGAVVLDEFHERNLNSDLALAFLRQVRQTVRPDLILMVMSATLDAEAVSNYLDACPIVRVDGGVHPVTVQYRPINRPADAEQIAPLIEEELLKGGATGHVLVFLPGMAEIRHSRDVSSRPPRTLMPLCFRYTVPCRLKNRIARCGRAIAARSF